MSETPTQTHYRICPLCEACCGLEVKVQAGRVIAIRGHEADVFSAGYICPKGVALKDLHEDPDRLRTPLVRRDGVLRPASWPEAFERVAQGLGAVRAAHGAHAVGIVVGNPSAHKMGLLLYFSRLAKALGTRNVFSASTLDQMPRQLASGLLYGHWLSVPVPDIARCDHLVVLGANPVASNGSMWTVPDFRGKARAMQQRGGRLVVIDPRRTETARIADEHHFIRPGTDLWLLLGMTHTLFDESLVRLGAAQELLDGVDALREAVRAFPAEAMAARCGIDAATIRALARGLARAPSAALYGRLGTCTQEHGTLASWLIDAINILTGRLDAPGGILFPKAAAFQANSQGEPGRGRGIVTGRHASRVSGAPEVFGELPVTCLAEEIETPGDGQIRALITVAGNPVLSAPDGPRLSAALGQLDFMVSLDIYLNETSRHADVVLPGVSALEDAHYDVPFPQFSWRQHARYSEPVFPRPEGTPEEWQTLLRLAAIVQGQAADVDVDALDDANFEQEVRRGLGAHASAVLEHYARQPGLRGPRRLLDLQLRTGPFGDRFGAKPEGLNLERVAAASRIGPDGRGAGGIDLGALAPRLPEVLRTSSGRVELAPPVLLAELARAATAHADAAPDDGSLLIIGRRDVRSNNSWMHNLPVLAKGPWRCTVLMHPDDARRAGLADGVLTRIENASDTRLNLQATLEISEDMMPGVISLPHGWGHDQEGTRLGVAARRPGANLNALFDMNARDPLSGNAVLSGVRVRVSAAAQAPA